MRGIFAAGVLDEFLQEKFNPFDLFIGVSAGAVTLASYLCRPVSEILPAQQRAHEPKGIHQPSEVFCRRSLHGSGLVVGICCRS